MTFIKRLDGRLPGARLQLTPYSLPGHCGLSSTVGRGDHVKGTKCSSFVTEWPSVSLCKCVCVRDGPRAGENTCECFCASRECVRGVTEREKGDNYIILWIRGVRRVIEAPLANGCTCNPAVMRQCWDHTPHTLSPIMYIINATACGKKNTLKKRYSPLWVHFPPPVLISSINADAAIKSQKSEVSADSSPRRKSGRAIIFDTGTLREIILSTGTKNGLSLSHSIWRITHRTVGQWEWRQPWPCYFCSSFRKQQAFHLGDARKKYAPLLQEKSQSVAYEEEWTNEAFRQEAHQNKPSRQSPP